MCGIAGVVYFDERTVDYSDLKKMSDRISHRGPDGEGFWIEINKKVGFAHRRLSIIDLSENAKQPMQKGPFTLTFNGEIYNYLELREQLMKQGEKFSSDSDTEVLLSLYALKGEKCLEDLDGMFAFSIWDDVKKRLFCARDRFGEKPFYYFHEPGKFFVFASEIKALFAYGIPKVINNKMLFNYLNNSYAISNPLDKSETFYDGVRKLEQSQYLTSDISGVIKKEKYWKLEEPGANLNLNFNEASEEFRRLFFQSVQTRMRSDVNVGSSLSGGLDSSSIVCSISQLMPSRRSSQNTFSARFKNHERDEGYFIQKVIDKTGVKSSYTWPDESGFVSNFEDMCYFQEEPFPSASIYAQYEVMRLAKEQNVTVLLDGQGADEILAGYEYYFNTFLKELYLAKDKAYMNNYIEIKSMHPSVNIRDFENESKIKSKEANNIRNLIRSMYKILNPSKYAALSKSYSEQRREKLFNKEFLNNFQNVDVYNLQGEFSTLSSHLHHSLFVNNLEDLLRFSDRNSMAFSREVRLPFLSHKLVEFVFSLPPNYKIYRGWSKYLLRKTFNDILPLEIAWRRDKVGYEPPQSKWMKHSDLNDLVSTSKRKLAEIGVIDKKYELDEDQRFRVLTAGYYI